MIKAHTFLISALGAVLSAAPVIWAQDVKPPEPTTALLPPPLVQELGLQPRSLLAFSLRVDPVFAPLTDTPDLSRYREFRFGMDVLAVAKQAEMEPSQARVIHQRPAVIQELEWRPQRSLAYSPQADPVQEVLFSFYNGGLFRIVVDYDPISTEGLTDEDMVEAISAKYGTQPGQLQRWSSSPRPRSTTTAKKSSRGGRTLSTPSIFSVPLTSLLLECWFSQSGWIRWPKRPSSKRFGWMSKRHRNERLRSKRSKMRRIAPGKRRPGW